MNPKIHFIVSRPRYGWIFQIDGENASFLFFFFLKLYMPKKKKKTIFHYAAYLTHNTVFLDRWTNTLYSINMNMKLFQVSFRSRLHIPYKKSPLFKINKKINPPTWDIFKHSKFKIHYNGLIVKVNKKKKRQLSWSENWISAHSCMLYCQHEFPYNLIESPSFTRSSFFSSSPSPVFHPLVPLCLLVVIEENHAAFSICIVRCRTSSLSASLRCSSCSPLPDRFQSHRAFFL